MYIVSISTFSGCIRDFIGTVPLDVVLAAETDPGGGAAEHSGSFTPRFFLEDIVDVGRVCGLHFPFCNTKIATGIKQCHALHDFLRYLSLIF